MGKRGTFRWRARIEWVDRGNGYSVGTGTWKIVRGTGAYKTCGGAVAAPSGPSYPEEAWMAGFLFRLESADGAPAYSPTLSAAVPDCPDGSMIYLGGRTLRVISRRDEEADRPPVLVVEGNEPPAGFSDGPHLREKSRAATPRLGSSFQGAA
jgi:hypothetical protein